MVRALEVFWLDVIKFIISLHIVWMIAASVSLILILRLAWWLRYCINSSLSFLKAFLFPSMVFFQASSNRLLTFFMFLCHSYKILFLSSSPGSFSWIHLLKSLYMLFSFTLKHSLLAVRISISVFSFFKLSFSLVA